MSTCPPLVVSRIMTKSVNRRNEHKIVIHGLKSLTAPGRVELKAAALREVTRLFEQLFGMTHGCTIVQVRKSINNLII